jgi:hypothetical protein
MRRYWVLALAAIALLGMLAPEAFAQAPAPKVTITGTIDQVVTYDRNLSLSDADLSRTNDTKLYERTRGLLFITGEVGTAKGVLGLEIDRSWGARPGANQTGTTGGLGLNTDETDASSGTHPLELKWLYTEFPVPLVPVSTVATLGAQPFVATYKTSVLATGDFAGLALRSDLAKTVRAHLTFVQIEEKLTGTRDFTGSTGEDKAVIFGVEVTPMKGLDIRPIYAYLKAEGTTASRLARGGVSNAAAANPTDLAQEHRHTIGVDARWKQGPWSFDPTFFYQFGNRSFINPLPAWGLLNLREADIAAWLVDLRGGWRQGPLNLEGMYLWTSGNGARDQLTRDINYFEPITADNAYYFGWAEILAPTVDYLDTLMFGQASRSLRNSIGYDRYGRTQFGVRATYSMTPALDLFARSTSVWTAKSVDTDGVYAAATGITPDFGTVNLIGRPTGVSSYLGTELNGGLTWRFAPGLTFDWVYAHLFAGNAFGVARAGLDSARDPEDVQLTSARIRYSF